MSEAYFKLDRLHHSRLSISFKKKVIYSEDQETSFIISQPGNYLYHFPIEVSIHITNPTGGTDDLKIKLLLAAQTTRRKQCQCIQWTVKIRWNTPPTESLTAEIPVIPVILFGKFKIWCFLFLFSFFFWWYDSQQSNIFLIQWHNFIFLIAYFKDILCH